jgi:hypothetical protein
MPFKPFFDRTIRNNLFIWKITLQIETDTQITVPFDIVIGENKISRLKSSLNKRISPVIEISEPGNLIGLFTF